MNRVSDGDRSTLLSFVSCGACQVYAPQSDEVISILRVLFRYVEIGTWFARNGTSDSTGGRAHNPPPLSADDRGAGERSVLVNVDYEDEGEAHPHLSQPLLLNQLLSASVFSSKPQLFFAFLWNGSSLVLRVRRRQLGQSGTPRKTSSLSWGTMRQPSWRWSSGHQP